MAGVNLYVPKHMQEGDSLCVLRGQVFVDASVPEVCRRLWSSNRRSEWDLFYNNAKILCDMSDAATVGQPLTRVTHVTCKLPYPFVDDRDFVVVEHCHLDESGTSGVIAFCSTEAIDVNPVDGCVRGSVDSSGFLISAVPGELRCKVDYTLYVDMKGQLPAKLASRFLEDVILSLGSMERSWNGSGPIVGNPEDDSIINRITSLVSELNAVHDEIDVFTPGADVVKFGDAEFRGQVLKIKGGTGVGDTKITFLAFLENYSQKF